MFNVKENFRAMQQRFNPEGLAVSATLASASPFAIIPLHALLTIALHETGREVPTHTLQYIAIGMLGVSNIVSSYVESRALNGYNYSASPTASTINMMTGHAFLSSGFVHMSNFATFFLFNPVSAYAFVNGDGRLLTESAGSVTLALTSWRTAMNTLILQGKIQPVVKRIRTMRRSVTGIFKKRTIEG